MAETPTSGPDPPEASLLLPQSATPQTPIQRENEKMGLCRKMPCACIHVDPDVRTEELGRDSAQETPLQNLHPMGRANRQENGITGA